MKKKTLSIILVSALALTLLAGCKSSASSPAATGAASSSESTAATTATTATAAPAADAVTLTVSLTTADTSACNKSCAKFKEVLEQASGGNLLVDIHPNAELAGDSDGVEGVQLGDISMTSVSTSVFAQYVPSMGVFDIPYLFDSRETFHSMMDDTAIGGKLESYMEDKGFRVVGWWDAGYRNLTNSKKEIKSPADLAGMKIRTMSSQYQVKQWELEGASPTPIAFAELYTALQQGTVDGQENPFGLIVSQKFYEVQPYLTTTGHILTVCPLVMSSEQYNSLSDQQKAWIDEAGKQATEFNVKAAADEENTAKQTLIDNDVTIYELSDQERAAFREKVAPLYDIMKADSALDSELVDSMVNFK